MSFAVPPAVEFTVVAPIGKFGRADPSRLVVTDRDLARAKVQIHVVGGAH